MSINERLLQTLMQNNPDASFGLEESFHAEIHLSGCCPAWSHHATGGAGKYRRFHCRPGRTNRVLLAKLRAAIARQPRSRRIRFDTLLTYSHDAVAQANLLAAHDFSAEAEQAYNLASQLAPTNFEAVVGLSDVLYHIGQANQAIQILNDFAQKNPSQQATVNLKRSIFTSK